MNRRFRSSPKTFNSQYPLIYGSKVQTRDPGSKPLQSSTHKNSTLQYPSNKALIEQRRATGQCFKCGEKYHAGHVYSNKSLNTIQGCDDLLEIYGENSIMEEENSGEKVVEEEEEEEKGASLEIGVSVHALSGEKQQDTIKVQGETKGQTLTILVDTGSTHSFMDFQTTKSIKAQMEAASPLVVTVANAQKVPSKLQCPGFSWTMQGQNFKVDLRVIRLDGSSIVLGIDWLRAYGRVIFDFQQGSITITKEGQPLVLKGINEGPN